MKTDQDQKVEDLVARGAIFYVNHSGGKDSQAMYNYLRRLVPFNQIVVVHADLGEVEWQGVKDHIRDNIDHPLEVVWSHKTFFDMVRHRSETRPEVPSWPSSAHRQCTSDLKRGPVYKFIRRDMGDKGATLGINCLGLRAEESTARAKKKVWQFNDTLSRAGRTVFDWHPILDWTTAEVFGYIKDSGQQPFHAYAKGNKRLSCVFCIMGCNGDLANGAAERPELYQKYVELELETGWTMFQGESLHHRVIKGRLEKATMRQEVAAIAREVFGYDPQEDDATGRWVDWDPEGLKEYIIEDLAERAAS